MMNRRIKTLWVKALKGDSEAYRRLGMIFLKGRRHRQDHELGALCLRKAMQMGNEKAWFMYHRIFSKGKEVIDSESYAEIYREYKNSKNVFIRKRLCRYLQMGTTQQIKEKVKHKGER